MTTNKKCTQTIWNKFKQQIQHTKLRKTPKHDFLNLFIPYLSHLSILSLIVLFVSYTRRRRKIKNLCKETEICFADVQLKIFIVYDVKQLENLLKEYSFFDDLALGLDCEWKPSLLNKTNKRGKISVLQLTNAKCTLLIRLHLFKLPNILIDVLKDPKYKKFGVGITQDIKYLFEDYNIVVNGATELNQFYQGSKSRQRSLDSLSQTVLNYALTKDKSITLSNWENYVLTSEQIEYAARDAIASRAIFMCLYLGVLFQTDREKVLKFSIKSFKTQNIPEIKVKIKKKQDNQKKKRKTDELNEFKKQNRLMRKSRKNNLYDNCALLAPDGEAISMIPASKMNWYLKRSLAKKIKAEGFVSAIQLNFEPTARTMTKDPFYLQEKENICVCCGSFEYLNKFYIVPYEFRKHFPFRFRVRSSHDIVLLCVSCRQKIVPAYVLRRKILVSGSLGDDFDEVKHEQTRFKIFPEVAHMKKLIHGYLKYEKTLPKERKTEMQNEIKKIASINGKHIKELNTDILESLMKMKEKKKNIEFISATELVMRKILNNEFDIFEFHGIQQHSEKCKCNFCDGDKEKEVDQEHRVLKPFIRGWRILFYELLQPEYLPIGWKLKHRIQDFNKI
eukprot:snap_masked-scaffold_26-processed-gene-4.33-mRNA-1 protein AED:1.00 eAED:1.00 QI:0/0/0/0/1/1/2/0/617